MHSFSSDEVCRTTLQPSTSAGAGVTATLTARPGATVSTAGQGLSIPHVAICNLFTLDI